MYFGSSERSESHCLLGHRYYTPCTGIGNGARRSIYAIVNERTIRVALSLTAWSDLAWFVASSKHKQTERDKDRRSYIVLYCMVLSKYVLLASCASFEGLTFLSYAYLSWKKKATYVDGVYSEGSSLQWSSALSGWISSRTFSKTVVAQNLLFIAILIAFSGVPLTPLVGFRTLSCSL